MNTRSAAHNRGDITLVILTHNRRGELARSLERLCSLPERPAIVVVDNGCTDDTAAFVRTWYPEIILVSCGSNLGAAGRNLGVEQVHTPLVAFSDDDTWWAPGSLAKASRIFADHPKIAVLNARIFVGPEERLDPACAQMQESPLETVPGVGPLLTGFMAGANVMRTAVFREAGGYWAPFFIGGEEALLAIDILDAGWQIAYAPGLCVHHWPSSERDSRLRRHLLARNAVWTTCLRLPWPLAMQRSRITLRNSLPLARARARVLAETARNMKSLLQARRLISPETCRLLQKVWATEDMHD